MPLTKVLTPGKTTCAAVAEQLGTPLATQLKSLVLASDEINENDEIVKTQVWLLLPRRPRDERGQGRQAAGPGPGLPAGDRGRDPGTFRLQAGLPGAAQPQEAGQHRGRPRGDGDGRHGSAAPTRPTTTRPASTGGAICPSPTWWPTSATWSRATCRRTARACWRSSAASRSAMFLPSAASIRAR